MRTLRSLRSDIKSALTDPQRFFRLMHNAQRRYHNLKRRGESPDFGRMLAGFCHIYHERQSYDKSIRVLMSLGSQYLNARRRLREDMIRKTYVRGGEQGSLF